jgi:hypothetical protein
MMTAITEVEVSKEDKMRKIEETERIKHELLLKKSGRWASPRKDEFEDDSAAARGSAVCAVSVSR